MYVLLTIILKLLQLTLVNQHPKSTDALREAIQGFPSVVPLLADKADIKLSGEVRSNPIFRIHPDARYHQFTNRAHGEPLNT